MDKFLYGFLVAFIALRIDRWFGEAIEGKLGEMIDKIEGKNK